MYKAVCAHKSDILSVCMCSTAARVTISATATATTAAAAMIWGWLAHHSRTFAQHAWDIDRQTRHVLHIVCLRLHQAPKYIPNPYAYAHMRASMCIVMYTWHAQDLHRPSGFLGIIPIHECCVRVRCFPVARGTALRNYMPLACQLLCAHCIVHMNV